MVDLFYHSQYINLKKEDIFSLNYQYWPCIFHQPNFPLKYQTLSQYLHHINILSKNIKPFFSFSPKNITIISNLFT